MSFLLVILNAGALCVARTDICAPANSIMTGTIDQQGGRVTITPAAPMKALGAEFRADAPLTVDVLPWRSSDKSSGSIVQVRGELSRESVISGAAVAGVVGIGQQQGRKGSPQLVEATDFRRGKLQVFTAGTITVAPGMRIQGGVELGGGRITITSQQAVHGLGLDFDAGVIQVDQRMGVPTISGTLARPQEIGGVLVERAVAVMLEPGHPTFYNATLARTTQLAVLDLPAGDAPAGTIVTSDASSTRLFGPGPAHVCGLQILPAPTVSQPAVTFTKEQARVTMSGSLGSADVDVGGGLHMTGILTVRYDAATCKMRSVEGSLARDSTQDQLLFARTTVFSIGEHDKDRFVRGTLAQPAVVDGLTVTGAVMVSVTPAGDVHLLEGTLVKASPFEQWQLPVRAHVRRSGVDGWAFEAPRGTSARAIADHRGERVDFVSEASSDGNQTTFTLTRPHQPKGTKLAFQGIGIDHLTGCVLGDVGTTQRFGMFAIPAGGSATVCGGSIVAAEGTYAVPSLQVGSWFATTAIAGAAGSPPPSNPTLLFASPARSSGALAGYWLQINSLCQGLSGIPQPPPAQRWIWVDLKGQATRNADQLVLAKDAAKAGKACPVTRCCPP